MGHREDTHLWALIAKQWMILLVGLGVTIAVGNWAARQARQISFPQQSVLVDSLHQRGKGNYLSLLTDTQSLKLTLSYLNGALGAALDEDMLPNLDLPKLSTLAKALPDEVAVQTIEIQGELVIVTGRSTTQQAVSDLWDALLESEAFPQGIALEGPWSTDQGYDFVLEYTQSPF